MSQPSTHAPESYIGRTIAGRYLVTRVLGAGGMGAVFVATQQPLGREVALKIIKRSLADDPDAVRRFELEARMVSQLSHPNIITLHDFGHDEDGTLFLAMELLDGLPLGELVQAGPLPVKRTLALAADICRALAVAHRKGVMHRDLKPDNVIVISPPGEAERAVVLDFGVAKLLENDAPQMTATGMVVGTPGYIAPEMLNGVMTDARSDLYALGVLWYEMLSGLSPFTDTTPMRLAVKHMTEPAPSLQSRVPGYGIPRHVEQLVMRLLAKTPDERGASTDAVLEEIEVLLKRLDRAPGKAALPPPGTPALVTPAVVAQAIAPQPVAPPISTPGTPAPMPMRGQPSGPVPVPVSSGIHPILMGAIGCGVLVLLGFVGLIVLGLIAES